MSHDTPKPGADGRQCYLHHGPEEVLITYPATLDAQTARRIVRGVLDSGRVPRPAPRQTPGRTRLMLRILPRLWVGAHVDEGRPYIIAFIGDQCVIRLPRPDAREGHEVGSA